MPPKPLSLRAYLALTHVIPLVSNRILKRRLSRGKEDPNRWGEKTGEPSTPRPKGPLLWINAVGLGEVLSLRGLIAELTQADKDLNILVTSTTRDSAKVFARNLPERTIHQFLPLDAPKYRQAFLDHWQPNAMAWAEQDIWPGFVNELNNRGIPQAIIASRMDADAFASRKRTRRLFEHLYSSMNFITAQDVGTAANLTSLGAVSVDVSGSLKPSAPPLASDPATVEKLRTATTERFVWTLASSYAEDETLSIKAHEELKKEVPGALLILVPRQINRSFNVPDNTPRWSNGDLPGKESPVWLADTIGDMGTILQISDAVLIGGTFNETQGHNPWEAAVFGLPILHGPKIGNFRNDFKALEAAQAAKGVSTATELVTVLTSTNLKSMGQNAQRLTKDAKASTKLLADRLLQMLNTADD